MNPDTRTVRSTASAIALAVVTPLAEKNPTKTIAVGTAQAHGMPVVLSMGRLIVLAFAVAMVHTLWLVGVAGWPEATLSIAVVLAMPILSAMERARPDQVLALATTLMTLFGSGAGRPAEAVASEPPSGEPSDGPRTEPSNHVAESATPLTTE